MIERLSVEPIDRPSIHSPLIPLYTALKELSPYECTLYLDRLDTRERQALLDIDLWKKDALDIESFHFWIEAYGSSCDKVRFAFVLSPSFALFLKGKFCLETFDVEDPHYPKHDNYFLTEDNLLLIEYEEDYEYADELKRFIRDIYTALGVENAYAYLLKIVSDNYSSMAEEEYAHKKGRLSDFGLPDYYDALELITPFPNKAVMDKAIEQKKIHTGTVDTLSLNQTVHQRALAPFLKDSGPLVWEMGRITDEKRRQFLLFNLVRLINGTAVLGNALKKDPSAMEEVGKMVKASLLLGLSYTLGLGVDSPLNRFEFVDLYRFGLTLTRRIQRKMKRAVRGTPFEGDRAFLGRHLDQFWEASFGRPGRFIGFDGREQEITTMEAYGRWEEHASFFTALIPFSVRTAQEFSTLKKNHPLQDSFYLNYTVSSIDFEALILGLFANFVLGNYKNPSTKKIGLTLLEFKRFITLSQEALDTGGFLRSFALDSVPLFGRYLEFLVQDHLAGLDLKALDDGEYRYIGGPIILNTI